MKKIFNNIALVLAAACLVFASCSQEQLDTEPTSSVAESNIFSSPESALMAVNGIHRLMHEGGSSGTTTSWYGQGGYTTFMLHLAWLSDDVVWTYENVMYKFTAQWTHQWNLTHTYNDLNYYWKLFYRITNNANKILETIDDKEACPSTDDGMRNFVKGQALAYRSFALFQLTQTWGERYYPEKAGKNDQLGAIIRKEPSFDNLPRSTVEQCYAQILDDINAAIECLGNIGTVTKANKTHIDIWVAKGLKARVLLTMGKWAEAAAVAEDVVNNSGAKLQDDTYTCGPFKNQMSDMENTEWLWAQGHSDDVTQHGALRAWHSFFSNNSASYNRNSPRAINNLLYATIPATDVRKNCWCEDPWATGVKKGNVTAPAGVNLWIPTGSARVCPWMSQKWLIDDGGVQNTYFDVPYMRLPEMMLIAAEGYARAGQAGKAEPFLLKLAQHRDPAYTLDNGAVAKGEDKTLINQIMWQRRVELWGEGGLRWLDLKRLNLPCDRGPKPRAGYNQGGTANGWSTSMKKMPDNLDPEASNYNMYGEQFPGESARFIPANSLKWQWLLPYNEINSNPLAEQNPTN